MFLIKSKRGDSKCMFKITKVGMLYIFSSMIFVIFQMFINQNPVKQEIQEFSQDIDLEANYNLEEWKIEIPKIALNANIAEGTTNEILNQYVGHFDTTSKEYGNIGLAAHNRGYKVNYFQDLRTLEKGDEIKYTYKDFQKIYEVEKVKIIKDTDWDCLENTEDNRLTLITCVENQPEYRRCVQAVEKEEVRY